jgi:membrane protein DedA with SNARE-associated domain
MGMTSALATLDALSAGHALPVLAWVHFDVIGHVRHWMHAAGYPVLFGLLLSCGLGLPLPEDVPLLLAGFFVAKGEMSLVPAAVFAWCGIIGGDCVLYSIGRRFGMGIVHVPVIGSHIRTDQIERLHEQFEKYGVWVVAVGRLFAGVRGAMVLVAGTIRFTFSHFLIADGIAAVFSGGMFLGLGYYAGRKFGDLAQIHEAIEQYSLRVLLGLVVAGLIAVAWMYWRKRRPPRPPRASRGLGTDTDLVQGSRPE